MTISTRTLLVCSALALGCDTSSSDAAAPSASPSAPSAEAAGTPAAVADDPADAGKGGDAEAAANGDAAAEGAEAEGAEAGDAAAADTAAGDAEPLTDAAVFVVRHKGVVVLTDAGFSTIEGSGSTFAHQITRDADGRVLLLGSSDIKAIAAKSLETVLALDYDAHGSVTKFAPDRAGGFWLTGSKGVVHIDGEGKTTIEPETTFGSGSILFAGVAVDENDQPWVATGDAVFTRADGAWASVKTPRGSLGQPFFEEVERAPDGAVFVRGAGFVVKIDAADAISRVKIAAGSYPILGEMAFSDAGIGVIRSDIEAVSVFAPAASSTRYRAPKDFKIGSISEVAADDQGRVWVVGEAGIAILGPAKERVTWRSGSQEAVAGQVNQLIVLGRGPALPGAGEVKTGGLTGRITKDDAGAAGLSIELCESPSFMYSRTPCSDAVTRLKGTTDADGRFTFENVPLGAYGVAVKVGRKWQVTMGTALGSTMKAGETLDIGDIALQAGK